MHQTQNADQSGIGARLEKSDRQILQVAVVKRLALMPFIRRSEHAVSHATTMLGILPMVACIFEYVGGGDVGWFVWTTAAVYGLLIAFMLFGARRSWAGVIELGPDIDAILDDEDRVTVLKWLDRALAWPPQVLVFLFGAAFSTWVSLHLTGTWGVNDLGNAGISYDVTIGLTGGVGAITVYWLWGAPALFYPLARIDRPHLDWVAPLQTPAVQKASRLMIDSSRLATVGLLLFTIPIAITLASASTHLSVWLLSLSPLVFSIVTVLGCSILPQLALEDMVRRSKREILATVRPYLPSPTEAFDNLTPEVARSVELYERLAKAPVSVFDGKRLLEYLLLLLSAVVPIVFALVSR